MSSLKQTLDNYLRDNSNATLLDFVSSNITSFSSHMYNEKHSMKVKLQKTFTDVYKQHYPDRQVPSISLSNDLCANLFEYNKKTPADIRDKIFQWFYCLSESRHEEFADADKVTLEDFLRYNGSHPRVLLDKMAIMMLKDFERLKPNDIHVLKLAMSYIVDMMNENEEVYRRYIKQDFFWEIVGRCPVFLNNYVEEQEAAAITSLCKRTTEAIKKSLSAAMLFVLEEQAKLVKEDKTESSSYQVLQAFSFMLNNFKTWKKTQKESETQKVCRVYDLINIFFEDSTLNVKIGETLGRTTEEACFLNEHNFSGGSSSNYNSSGFSVSSVAAATALSSSSASCAGRKIDMTIVDDDKDELSYCEFKATNGKSLAQHQQSKSCRLNATIAHKMLKLFVDEHVVSFVWTGCFGEFCSLKEHEGVFVSRLVEPFVIPTQAVQLDEDIAKTFIMLIGWKVNKVV
ncbi:hypothetical protein A0J61_06957 [Choanephora cucurbitarum]|uniref:Uncharacterized protein n=1 Tax=Choanephora cucurbitarum TaxID=101091 RepID=A0A1C7N7G8_9FUNG|nr:hypothetical protein A0J61_06957 [Choanephora cucurbitarum]